MQIKSWQIALTGVIIALIKGLFYGEFTDDIFLNIALFIPVLMLYFNESRNLGAVISLIIGFFRAFIILDIIYFSSYNYDSSYIFLTLKWMFFVRYLTIAELFLLLAGVYNFRNEIKIRLKQIKSWQIILAGTIVQAFLIGRTYYDIFNIFFPGNAAIGQAYGSYIIFSFVIAFYSIIGLSAILLFRNIETRPVASKTGIFLGLLFTLVLLINSGVEGVLAHGIQGIFIVIAGIYYFKKERNVQL